MPAKADGFEWGSSDGGGYDASYDWGSSDGGYDWGYSTGGDYDWGYSDGGGYYTDYSTPYDWGYSDGGGYYADDWSSDSWSYDNWSYDSWSYDTGSYYTQPYYYDTYYTQPYYIYDEYYYDTPSYNPPHYNPPPRQREEVNCEIEASDTSIEEGDSITLRWDSDNADSLHINQGIGSVSRSGSERVSPRHDTTYTLTVENRDDTETCSVTVRVDEDRDSNLSCDLTASDRSIERGDSVTLEWDTRDADEARINQGIGRVDEDGGTKRVRPTRDTTYVLTVENDNGDEEDCSVKINVEDDGLAPPPDEPIVYLSQLPYTGAADSMTYWMLLIIGSGVLGYALFFRALPFAMARVGALKSDTDVTETPAGEGEQAPQNVTRQDVRAFVSAIAEKDAASAREFAKAGGSVLFAETAVVLDDVMRARTNGSTADTQVASMTTGWDATKFEKLIAAFADADEAETTVDEALKD